MSTYAPRFNDRRYFFASVSSIFKESQDDELFKNAYFFALYDGTSPNHKADMERVKNFVEAISLEDVAVDSKDKLQWERAITNKYIYMLEHCVSKKAERILILEDDIIVSYKFIDKAMKLLDDIEDEGKGISYLKLFKFTTQYGWSLNMDTTITTIVFLIILPIGTSAQLAFIYCYMMNVFLSGSRKYLSKKPEVVALLFYVAIMLFLIIVGKQSLDYMVTSPGGYKLDTSVPQCCAEGHLFPARVVPNVIQYLKESYPDKTPPVDHFLSFYARDNEPSYEMIPNVIQHVGTISSGEFKRKTTPTFMSSNFENTQSSFLVKLINIFLCFTAPVLLITVIYLKERKERRIKDM
eukprot:TRINITY_DN7021_c0_g1_i1.p1 TRINITY_DN7021_c0_g1~~TRINITY_DN7021_c0_g1_i1.p1  ORF type:complete len:352 (-),score=67.84 TRINITY_DN7021_c0_g1_i1:53-1108(-)